MATVEIKNTGKILACGDGECLMDVLLNAGELSMASCGGRGTCGKCKVVIPGKGEVLACETRVHGSLEVQIPVRTDGTQKEERTDTPENFAMYAVDKSECWKLAVDIGTTTVEAILLQPGESVPKARITCWNSQRRYGTDVLTRISYVLEHPEEGLTRLQQALIEDLNTLIGWLCRRAHITPDNIGEIAVAANCTMTHLLLGEDVSEMGRSPYRPAFKKAQVRRACDLGLTVGERAQVYCFPQTSAFLGGDIMAGISTIENFEKRKILFVDIGTNGEIVLSDGKRLFGCSCAAGPALEGMNISAGMHAAEGAVEGVRLCDRKVQLQVIGDAKPAGLCGSGVLSMVRELLREGFLRPNGTFVQPSRFPEGDFRRKSLRLNGTKREFVLDGEQGLVFTQGDVRQVQFAKGAVLSGIQILLAHAGVAPGELEQVIVAGQFGRHLAEDALLTVGILPPETEGKIVYAGNSSCQGACAALIDLKVRQKAEKLAERTKYLELSQIEGYDRIFAECTLFRRTAEECEER